MANPELENHVPNNPFTKLIDALDERTFAIEYLKSVGWVDIIPGKREPYIIEEPLPKCFTAEGFKMVDKPAFKDEAGVAHYVKTVRIPITMSAPDDPKKVVVFPNLVEHAVKCARGNKFTHIYGITIARTPVHGLLPPDLFVTLRGRRIELPPPPPVLEYIVCPHCKGKGIVPSVASNGNYPYVMNGRMYYAPSIVITSQSLYDGLKERTGLSEHQATIWTVDDFWQEIIPVHRGRSIDLAKGCNHFISLHSAQGRPAIEEFRTNMRKVVCAASPSKVDFSKYPHICKDTPPPWEQEGER